MQTQTKTVTVSDNVRRDSSDEPESRKAKGEPQSPEQKQQVIQALRAFVNQRSGIEWGNYGGSREAFMGDYRPILRHGKHARQLLREVELRDSITAQDIIKASEQAYAGRLTINANNGTVGIEYCTGQYFPTEYRNAVCAVLASVLWNYCRANNPEFNGPEIRKWARREFGRAIAKTWFN